MGGECIAAIVCGVGWFGENSPGTPAHSLIFLRLLSLFFFSLHVHEVDPKCFFSFILKHFHFAQSKFTSIYIQSRLCTCFVIAHTTFTLIFAQSEHTAGESSLGDS